MTEKKQVIDNPQLMTEWDWKKNNELGLDPNVLTCGSDKKAFWKCINCGFEWKSAIGSRSRGHGCHACADKQRIISNGKYRLEKSGSLADNNPTIAAEWHPTKNGTLRPTDVTSGSAKAVWWQCKKGHEWFTAINNRSRGTGCPICNSEKQTSFPEQAVFFYLKAYFAVQNRARINGKELDIYLPEQKVGIEYDGIYYHTSQKAIIREKEKDDVFRSLGIRLIRIKESSSNRLDNDIILFRYDDSYSQLSWAIESLLKLLETRIHYPICLSNDRQQIYEQYIVAVKADSISTLRPDLAQEWNFEKNDSLTPEYFSMSSHKKVYWICDKGHEWQATIRNRVSGNNCPVCSNKRIMTGYNDVATINPQIIEDWDYNRNPNLNPKTLAPNVNVIANWKCHICGREWKATVNNRSQGHGCPTCGGLKSAGKRIAKLIDGNGSLVENYPTLIREWHPTLNGTLLPSMVTVKSSESIYWICSCCGHVWSAPVYSRTTGHGCPVCGRKKAAATRQKSRLQLSASLQEKKPELAAEWNYAKNKNLTPEQVTECSHKRVGWICSVCGYEWDSIIANRSRGSGCPECAKNKRFKSQE